MLPHHKDQKSAKVNAGKRKVKTREQSVSVELSTGKHASVAKKPKPWYCFRCGKDRHIASGCTDPPNPALVNIKRKELKEKDQAWEKGNPSHENDTLN